MTVLRNLRRRVEGLCIDIRNYASTVGNLEYRVESLCRDVLQYRHCIPNHEEVSDFLISAKRILDSESELHNLSTTRRTGRGDHSKFDPKAMPKWSLGQQQRAWALSNLNSKTANIPKVECANLSNVMLSDPCSVHVLY